METSRHPSVRLIPWSEDAFWLLVRQNSPEMTAYLGGPEPEEKLADRHRRYLAPEQRNRMFRIVVGGGDDHGAGEGDTAGEGEAPEAGTAGSIGYWEREWRGGPVWETGWAVLPEFQGRGIAAAAVRLLCERARAEGRHHALHAFPAVANAASNALCRTADFTLLGAVDLEYPKGRWSAHNDWRFDLARAGGPGSGGAGGGVTP